MVGVSYNHVPASHLSKRAITSIAKYIKIAVKTYSAYSSYVDGQEKSNWIAIDIEGTVMIHIFTQESSSLYNFNELIKSRLTNN